MVGVTCRGDVLTSWGEALGLWSLWLADMGPQSCQSVNGSKHAYWAHILNNWTCRGLRLVAGSLEQMGVRLWRCSEQAAGQCAEVRRPSWGRWQVTSHLPCSPRALAALQVRRLEGLGADPRTGCDHKVAAPHTLPELSLTGLQGMEGFQIPGAGPRGRSLGVGTFLRRCKSCYIW